MSLEENKAAEARWGIHSYAYSVDFLFDASFNAKPWFEQASDQQIKALIESGFTGEPAKQLAWFFGQPLSDVELILNHYRIAGVDFIVEVHAGIAAVWILRERPHLANLL